MKKAKWTRRSILQALRSEYRAGRDLSYNAMARRFQALVSAAAYHFSSYPAAVRQAGIDYAQVTRRPRWTRLKIIRAIKQARRQQADLNWAAVSTRRDELGRAAFAAVQKRLFGSWPRALHAAGLDADEVSCYRNWDRDSVAFELRQLYRDGQDISSGALQKEDPGLHAAAVRHFGSYDAALRAAKVDPDAVRHRRRWDRAEVIRRLRQFQRQHRRLTAAALRTHAPALYAAMVRQFGTLTAARARLAPRRRASE